MWCPAREGLRFCEDCYRRTGDAAKAREHLTTAATMYREMDMGFWLEKAEAAAGSLNLHSP